jgi:hypothetical protein
MRQSNVKKKEIFMPAPSEAFTIAMLYKEEKAKAGYQAAVLLSSSVATLGSSFCNPLRQAWQFTLNLFQGRTF